MDSPKFSRRYAAFTLIEIMIAVAIVGLLAAFAVPAFKNVTDSSRMTRFVSDCRVFESAAQQYMLLTGRTEIDDTASGVLPSYLEGYITLSQWDKGTPIGGLWDFDLDYGFLGVGSAGTILDSNALDRLEARFDDGDPDTGRIRIVAGDRVYWVIE